MRRGEKVKVETIPVIYPRILLLMLMTAFLLGLSVAAIAQLEVRKSMYQPGTDYVITRLNDTLPGTVSYGKKVFGGMLNKIQFVNQETGAKVKFRANELTGFEKDGQSYTTKKYEGFSYFFREAITGGYVNLYYLEYAYQKGETPNLSPMNEVRGSNGKMIFPYLEKNGELHRVYRGTFSKQAGSFFRDKEATLNKVNSKEWTFEDIEEIVVDYNKDNS